MAVARGFIEPSVGEAAKLRQAVLRAITDGLLPSKPLRRLVWSENGIREAERRLAWADATKGREFPSGAFLQWREVFYLDPVPRPVWREVFEGLEESVKASVYYLVVQVLLGNEDAKAMVEGSGIVIPGPVLMRAGGCWSRSPTTSSPRKTCCIPVCCGGLWEVRRVSSRRLPGVLSRSFG